MSFSYKQPATLFVTAVLLFANFVFTACSGGPEPKNNHQQQDAGNAPRSRSNAPATEKTMTAGPDVYDSTRQYIYLTFDDGPQPGTMECYRVIKETGVKASFFMVGLHEWDAHLKRIVDTINNSYPAILVANHSYTHAFRDKYKTFYTHPYAALADFKRAQDTLKVPYNIIRLPGNNCWVRNGVIRASRLTRPVCALLDSAGYKVIGWDVEWNFKPEQGGAHPVQSVATMVKMVENTLQKNECYKKNNIVVLAHDRMFHTAAYTDSLHKFVASLKQNPHYVFETVDRYPMQEQTKKL